MEKWVIFVIKLRKYSGYFDVINLWMFCIVEDDEIVLNILFKLWYY